LKQNESSMTSLIASFGRAYHRDHDEPVIFDDYLAKELMSEAAYHEVKGYMTQGISFFAPEMAEVLKSDEERLKWVVQTQLAPTPLARAAYTEQVIANEEQLGLSQYVLLGAGMDTFAFRKGKNLQIFEVDHPATQLFKKDRIEKVGWELPPNLHMAAVDFTKDDLVKHLAEAGFDPQKKTVFSLLGVSYYLSKEAFQELLNDLKALMTEGSSIIFDYADQGLFDSGVKRVQNMLTMAKQGGEPMQSAYELRELEKMLEAAGLLIYEHLNPEEIQEAFFKNRTDDLKAFEHMHYIHAVYRGI